MRQSTKVFFAAFACVTVAFFVFCYRANGMQNLKCIISSVDGERYCVRDRKELKHAANLIARATNKCKELVVFVGKKYGDREDVRRLVANFNPRTISETLPTSEYTAYTENKGDAMAFCLNEHKGASKLIDLNTLTFVAIHELGHVMTESMGHKQIFWENFKFLLENAVELGIVTPIDYKKKPQPFCGMTISDNPYYDM